MFQVPEDKAHLRRESNSRHVSESGPHAPGPMYLQGSRNVSEVPRGPASVHPAVPPTWALRTTHHQRLHPLLSWALNTVGIRSVRAPFCVAGVHIARNSVRPLRETSRRSSCHHSTALCTHTHSRAQGTVLTGIITTTYRNQVPVWVWVWEAERKCVCVQECIIADGNLTSPSSRFPARGTSPASHPTKHWPHPGRL